MADSMCGPSDGAKNLVNFTERDRSLQQDRLGGLANGTSETFRSSVTRNGTTADFEDFQAARSLGNMPLIALGHAGFPLPGDARESSSHNRLPPLAPTGIQRHNQAWVDQFAGLSLARGQSDVIATPPRAANMAVHGLTRLAHPVINPGMARVDFQAQILNQYRHLAGTGMTYYDQAVPSMGHDYGEDVALTTAFDQAFNDVEADQFQHELQQWMDDYNAADVEEMMFEDAQNEWMREHGPQCNKISTEEEVDAGMTETANETAKIEADNALATAALDILASVSNNSSERFRQSNFLELMRRIGAREVVVNGDNLVETATGNAVFSKDDIGDDSV